MTSTVLELQRELLKSDCDIVSALRKAHLIATKLKLPEIDAWIQNELNGYTCSNSEIPEYRNVQGMVKLRNPVRGWTSVIIEDKADEDLLSHRKLFQSISEIVGFSVSGKSLCVPFPGSVSQKISQMVDAPIVLEAALFITKETLKGVSDKVKNTLLEWTISLEETTIETMTMIESTQKAPESLAQEVGTGKMYDNISGVLSTPLSSGIELREESEQNTMSPIIFISHRTEDSRVADMLRDYLVATSIPNEYIFCSSLPGNNVKSVIPREVKEKIATSAVNIAILSRGYYESAYCINEAGIIWLHDPETPAIVVGLPEISQPDMIGFLDDNYILRRLDDINDISEIYDIIKNAVGAPQISLAVAMAAGQKLSERYREYLKNRLEPTVSPVCPIANITQPEDITTDDERVVLYYILTKKVRCIRKSDVLSWMRESEIYNINVDNALDLLATLGDGSYKEQMLTMDVGIFRKYTANAESLVQTLTPIVEKYQDLSSKRFVAMWDAGAFTDEDKLFVAYIIQNRVVSFGTRWLKAEQVESIRQWELRNGVVGRVSRTYSTHLNHFIENQFIYESCWTDDGSPNKYTLYPSVTRLLFASDFPYTRELEVLLDTHR